MGMVEGKNNIRFEISVINCLKRHPTCHVFNFSPSEGMGMAENEGKNIIRLEIKVINLLETTPHMPCFEIFNFSSSEDIGYG